MNKKKFVYQLLIPGIDVFFVSVSSYACWRCRGLLLLDARPIALLRNNRYLCSSCLDELEQKEKGGPACGG